MEKKPSIDDLVRAATTQEGFISYQFTKMMPCRDDWLRLVDAYDVLKGKGRWGA